MYRGANEAGVSFPGRYGHGKHFSNTLCQNLCSAYGKVNIIGNEYDIPNNRPIVGRTGFMIRDKKDLDKKRGKCIIGFAALGLLLAACSAPPGSVDGIPDEWEGDTEEEMKDAETKKEWPKEQDSCEVQALSGYLYEHILASPYASAEIAIKDYEGEMLEDGWDVPSVFQFEGEADVTWRFYDSLAEMETVLNEAAVQEPDGSALHFLYYTFPLTENDHALDLYHTLKRQFDSEAHPLTAWSADNGKLFYYIQETLKEEDGHEFSYLYSRSSKVNLYVKDRTAYGLTLLNAPTEEDDEALEYVFKDVFQRYGILGSGWGWGLDEESLYWVDHEERRTKLEDPKRSFLEVRGIDENTGPVWKSVESVRIGNLPEMKGSCGILACLWRPITSCRLRRMAGCFLCTSHLRKGRRTMRFPPGNGLRRMRIQIQIQSFATIS